MFRGIIPIKALVNRVFPDPLSPTTSRDSPKGWVKETRSDETPPDLQEKDL